MTPISALIAFFCSLSRHALWVDSKASAFLTVCSALRFSSTSESLSPSSSSYIFAFHIALWISSSERLEEDVIVIDCSLPVPRSLADTFTIPFASISKVTSIWGTPAGALFIPESLKFPISLLSLVNLRSPWNAFTSTDDWKLAAVVNIWLCLVGIVVFLSISLLAIPPTFRSKATAASHP